MLTKKEIDAMHDRAVELRTTEHLQQLRLIAHIRELEHEMEERSKRTTLIHNALVETQAALRDNIVVFGNPGGEGDPNK